MSVPCWIDPPAVEREIIAHLSSVDSQLCRAYELQPDMREEHVESRLATLIETTPFDSRQHRINQLRYKRGMMPLSISFSASHVTRHERHHGADLGLIATIEAPGDVRLTKAALVQGKRLTPTDGSFAGDSEYAELFKSSPNLPPQWQRMLDVTSASEYFLYGPRQVKSSRGMIELGTRVISAHAVLGMANAGRSTLTAQEAPRRSKPMAKWLVEDFLCCSRGDSNPWVIETARGSSSDFPVENTLEITVTVPFFPERQFGRFR